MKCWGEGGAEILSVYSKSILLVPGSWPVQTNEKGGRAEEKQTSEKGREERRVEPVSFFSNTSIRPLTRPLPGKPFIVSK